MIRRLSLTRRYNEKIIVGEDVILTVGRVIGDQVKLYFEAPESVPIDRIEIREQKEARASLEKPHAQQPKDAPKKTQSQNRFKLNTIVRVKKSKKFDKNGCLPHSLML